MRNLIYFKYQKKKVQIKKNLPTNLSYFFQDMIPEHNFLFVLA